MSIDLDQIVVSDKFKHNDEGFKHFIGYLKGEIIQSLCIILPQMSGYIKYIENGSKSMSFYLKMINQVLNFVVNLFMNINT